MAENKSNKVLAGNKDDQAKAPISHFYWKNFMDVCPTLERLPTRSFALLEAYRDFCEQPDLEHLRRLTARLLRTFSLENEIPLSSIDKVIVGTSYIGKHGADKYGKHNYRRGFKWSRLVDALGRHLLSYVFGHPIDEDSGHDHRYHMVANILMLAEHIANDLGENDLKGENYDT